MINAAIRQAWPQFRKTPVMPSQVSAPSSRIEWIDQARGLAMVLVVLGHVAGGLIDAQLTSIQGGIGQIFAVIYTFHMPFFFFLSALFTPRRLSTGGGRFARSWLPDLVYPAALWSIIMIGSRSLSPAPLNHPVPPFFDTLLTLPHTPAGPYWFIYSLLLLHFTAYALRNLNLSPSTPFVLIAFGGLLAVFDMHGVIGQTAKMAPWYAFGLWMGADSRFVPAVAQMRKSDRLLVIALFAILAWALTPSGAAGQNGIFGTNATEMAQAAWQRSFAPYAVLGSAATIALACLLPAGIGRAASYIGQRTMAIYMMHVMIVAGLRVVLVKLHITSAPLLLVPLTVAGLLLPALTFDVAARLNISRYLGLGRPLRP